MKTKEQIKEAFDLISIMQYYVEKQRNSEALQWQYHVLAWILCDGESADPFESLLETGRKFMRECNAKVTRVMPGGKLEKGKDYARPDQEGR